MLEMVIDVLNIVALLVFVGLLLGFHTPLGRILVGVGAVAGLVGALVSLAARWRKRRLQR